MNDDNDLLDQLEGHLNSSNLNWLLGAGICKDANIPLMAPLTNEVLHRLADKPPLGPTLAPLLASLGELSHIEHILSHLGDACAMAKRTRDRRCRLLDRDVTLEDLEQLHGQIQDTIVDIVRIGLPADHTPGNPVPTSSLITIDSHLQFIRAMFATRQHGVAERRHATQLFTTNYDTLLEDALALSGVQYWDGFTGGAVAYRSQQYRAPAPEGHRAHVVKLHGSIDWRAHADGRIFRTRYGDLYPGDASRVVIYPQATKYVATQKDPFSSQFDGLRRALDHRENVLAICGYSFGDDHINHELAHAMERDGNRTTILAFTKEINTFLEELRNRSFGSRIYIMTEAGLFVGKTGPHLKPAEGLLTWWTFQGVIRMLQHGPQGAIA